MASGDYAGTHDTCCFSRAEKPPPARTTVAQPDTHAHTHTQQEHAGPAAGAPCSSVPLLWQSGTGHDTAWRPTVPVSTNLWNSTT